MPKLVATSWPRVP